MLVGQPSVAHRIVQIRYLSSSVVCNIKYKKEQYRTVDQVISDKSRYALYPGKTMYKLLFRNKKQNPFFIRPPVGAPSISLQSAAASVYTGRICSSKRVRVLNKLFMRYIPEILATSELGIPLVDYDIQFSRVRVGPHYDIINVFWVPKGTEEDEVIQQILNQVAYPLRSELINLKLMGLLPRINFTKDKHIALLKELDRRIRIADYGEDYVPSFLSENIFKKELQLEIQLPKKLQKQITLTEKKEQFTEHEEKNIPAMITNTLGLNYENIMNTILDGKKKATNFGIESFQTTESLIGQSAIKEVPFNYEAQIVETWDKNAFKQYIKSQKSKQKLILRTRNRMFSDEMREASRIQFLENKPEDEEYIEFEKNIFPDIAEDFDENKSELEQ